MKHSILGLIFIATFGPAALAGTLKLENVGSDWTVHFSKAGSEDSILAPNTDATINYHEVDHSPEATIFVQSFPAPAQKLEGDVNAWHQAVFARPARNKPIPVDEGVIKVGGQWRYLIHFQVDNGSMLNTMAMATIVNGKLYLFVIEQHRNLLVPLRKSVAELYKTIKISELPGDTK